MTYKDYNTWHDQEVLFPGLRYNDWVMLTPPELNGITGRIVMENGSGESWGVHIPYGGNGALIYVHKADVAPAPDPTELESW